MKILLGVFPEILGQQNVTVPQMPQGGAIPPQGMPMPQPPGMPPIPPQRGPQGIPPQILQMIMQGQGMQR